MNLLDFLPEKEKTEIDIIEAERLASTKYRENESIQTWLRIYRHGTSSIKTRNGKIDGIKPFSNHAKENLIKAIRLRENGNLFKLQYHTRK